MPKLKIPGKGLGKERKEIEESWGKVYLDFFFFWSFSGSSQGRCKNVWSHTCLSILYQALCKLLSLQQPLRRQECLPHGIPELEGTSRISRIMLSFTVGETEAQSIRELTNSSPRISGLVLWAQPKDMLFPLPWLFGKWQGQETVEEGSWAYKESGIGASRGQAALGNGLCWSDWW